MLESRSKTQFWFTTTTKKARDESLFLLRLHIRFALQQQTAGFKAAFGRRAMQWSRSTEGNFRVSRPNTVSVNKNDNNNKKSGANHSLSFASTSALLCSSRRQISRQPLKADQCSGVIALERMQESQAKTQFRFETKTSAGQITQHYSPPHPLCSAAADGRCQGGLF
jgi:hypothetical protein